MRRWIFLICLFSVAQCVVVPYVSAQTVRWERQPRFGDGDVGDFQRWVQVRFDERMHGGIAKPYDPFGRIVLSFAVDAKGCVRHVDVLQTPDRRLGRIAARLVASSSAWTPGERNIVTSVASEGNAVDFGRMDRLRRTNVRPPEVDTTRLQWRPDTFEMTITIKIPCVRYGSADSAADR